jgi:L-amino acid N-acyltransferase
MASSTSDTRHPGPPMLRECLRDDVAAIREIFNEVILTSAALFEYEPRSYETVAAWLDAKQSAGLPVIGAVDEAGRLAGFATYGSFRPFAAYRLTVEHSVYVHAESRGRGVGRALLAAVIEEARRQGMHLMVGGIEAGNTASRELHRSLGFTHAGTVREAGRKFDRWLDLEFWQKPLS